MKTTLGLIGGGLVAGLMLAIYFLLFASGIALAHDDGQQWEGSDPETRSWYQTLQRPDMQGSCCGEADAYWCDEYYARDNRAFCRITDPRPDGPPRNRQHIPVGTEIEIPTAKLKYDKGNPTGHNILFILRSSGTVLCFVQRGGV